jgi:dTDP-glucose 4,6-dehydratase
VHDLCNLLDGREPTTAPHGDLITFVADRPGHDHRYAIDAASAHAGLGWRPTRTFEVGLAETIDWYRSHPEWCAARVGASGLVRRGVANAAGGAA